jgi:hypothetical protein
MDYGSLCNYMDYTGSNITFVINSTWSYIHLSHGLLRLIVNHLFSGGFSLESFGT